MINRKYRKAALRAALIPTAYALVALAWVLYVVDAAVHAVDGPIRGCVKRIDTQLEALEQEFE